jgi:hypothetical protein
MAEELVPVAWEDLEMVLEVALVPALLDNRC